MGSLSNESFDEFLDSLKQAGVAISNERQTLKGMFGLTSTAAQAPPSEQKLRIKAMKTESLRGSGRGEGSLYAPQRFE